MTVTTAIIPIPRIKAKNCLIDSFGSSSFKRSGSTVTKAICRNVPAVNGIIHDVLASKIILNWRQTLNYKNKNSPIELEAPLQAMAMKEPMSPPPAVKIWYLAASHLVKPDLRSMAKSPTSWGISCTKIAKVVKHPILQETRNAPPNDKPCVKLSIEFASKFK